MEDARRRLREDLEELRAEVASMLAGEESEDNDVRNELGRMRTDMNQGFASLRLEMEIAEARRLRDEMERMLSGLVRDLREVADRMAGR